MPDWITVNTGLFGTKESFAPLHGSSVTADGVVLPFGKNVVKGAPEIKDAAHLDADEQDALYTYYQGYTGGRTAGTQYDTTGTPTPPGPGQDRRQRRRLPDPLGGAAARRHPAGGSRPGEAAEVRRHRAADRRASRCPTKRSRSSVSRLQPGDSLDGATIGEDSIEVALMQDEVLVDKEVVGVEKVKLATQTVTEQQQVTDQVRKEQIEVDGDTVGAVDPNARKR